MKTGSPANPPRETASAGKSGVEPRELRELRARFLSLTGRALIEIQGWLIGVACAVERQRKADPRDTDRLIAELRASSPPDFPMPVICPKCNWPDTVCGCGPSDTQTDNRTVPDSPRGEKAKE